MNNMHEIVIIIAKFFIVIPIAIAIYVWLKLSKASKIQFIIIGVISSVVALALAKIAGHLFYDPRPFVAGNFTPYFSHARDNGFVSDHTLLGTLLAFLVLIYDRRLGVLALIVALLIGAARVIAGVHHLVDIIGALMISGLSVGLVYGLSIWWNRRHAALETEEK